ncbi:MAG TPA: peptidyl-prolyl cis-trans isomerase, partial [Flavobacterium sp.]|nr:peptidyl-prolyl cis-trans isomerase [Flavobacterium sp.]
VEKALLDYEESMLEVNYPEFKALMGEYRDGILLFELTDERVWSKAVKDSVGLKAFYENNKSKYMWGPRVEATIYTVKNADVAEKLRKLLKKKASPKDITEKLNEEDEPDNVKISRGIFEKGQNEIVDKANMNVGLTDNIQNTDGSFTIVSVERQVPPEPKTLQEAKGYVVSDYQEHLEKEWISDLRKKYPVQVNEQVLLSLVKK